MTMELQETQADRLHLDDLQSPPQAYRRHEVSSKTLRPRSSDGRTLEQDALPSPVPSASEPEALKWNSSRSTMFRVCVCFYALLMMGANDAAYGALILYVC